MRIAGILHGQQTAAHIGNPPLACMRGLCQRKAPASESPCVDVVSQRQGLDVVIKQRGAALLAMAFVIQRQGLDVVIKSMGLYVRGLGLWDSLN